MRHSKDLAPGSTVNLSESTHRHSKSLDIGKHTLLSPHHKHYVKKFLHDRLGVGLTPERSSTDLPYSSEPISEEPNSIEPPLTPKIQVMAPPDDLSDDEIQYIGVGLGTLSNEDKRLRQKSPARATTAPDPTLQHRRSSDSIRSDSSLTSGQLTPSKPMVYESPVITHENVFEHAFQRAEDKIRLQEGEHTMVYNTWRSEEVKGQPISNQYGRMKVEFERVDGEDNDPRPRWERILNQKFPEKLAELHKRKGGRTSTMKRIGSFSEEMLGDRAWSQLDQMKGTMDNVSHPGDVIVDIHSQSIKHYEG
jgi:hypothetical protein